MISYPVLANKGKITINNTEIWNLLQKTFRIPKEFEYQLIEVTDEYICRPDLLSIHLYDTPNHADILCKLNGISNPFELDEGMYILAPSINDIPSFYITNEQSKDEDNSLVSENGGSVNKGKDNSVLNLQKKKNAPRKANEQVLGNSNFRIDKTNKIVIY